jgi:hypothetical protein
MILRRAAPPAPWATYSLKSPDLLFGSVTVTLISPGSTSGTVLILRIHLTEPKGGEQTSRLEQAQPFLTAARGEH